MAHVQLLIGVLTILFIVTGCDGQTSVCGGNLTSQAGTIISPNFPNGYPDYVTCIWTITVADKQIITLRFHNFEVDIYDSVLFYDGDSIRKPIINETLNGYWSDSKLSNFRIRTTGPKLHVVFKSNAEPSGPGFSASYWAHECAPFTYGIDYCDKKCTCQEENTLYCNSTTSQCVCKGGWNSTRCDVDVNECDDPNRCPDLYSRCVNSIGSFACVCRTGLQLSSTGICQSTCTSQQNRCSHACGVISTNPFIEQCYCPKGMQLNSTNNQTCVECRDWFYGEDCKYQSSCSTYRTKVFNKVNGLCTCYLNWTSTDCTVDVDECIFSPCNVNNSYCSNYQGSYECTCYFGFENPNADLTMCNECGKTLTNTSGIISSNYYNDYNNFYLKKKYDVCSWIISVEKGHVIDLRFTNFNFYNGYRTYTGYVRLYDGSNVTAPLLGHFDGQNYHNGRLPPNYIRSSGNKMYVARTAQRYYSYGFDVSYTSHECQGFFYDTNCLTPCNCNKTNTDYCNSTTGQCICKPQWTSPECTVDKNECLVDPLACPNYSDCTNLQPGYKCDCKMGLEKNATGQCIFSTASSTACARRQCSHVCVKLKSTIDERCYCPVGMVLAGDTCVNCSKGTFGPDCSLKSSCVENNTVSNNPVTGQCFCLPGWTSENCSQDVDECYLDLHNCSLSYSASNCRNTAGDYACDCIRANGFENIDSKNCKRIDCSNILTNSTGIITSPDYPKSYFNNANCSWLITVNEGNVISLRFENFSTGMYNYDYVMFYNGNDSSSKVIGRYSGELETIPHIIRSNGNRMFINFLSRGYGGYATGFKATYTSHTCRYYTFGETCTEYCHCNSGNTQFCDNIKGDCVCKPGWKGNTCFDDVDECLGTNIELCPTYSDCINTPGSYYCKCRPGYVMNVSTAACEVSNNCYRKTCSYSCYSQNGVEQCVCPKGLELDVTGLVCVVPYYPYGSGANDEILSSQMYGRSLNQGAILVSPPIYFSTAAPFGNSQKLYKVAYVRSNGLIVFGDERISASPNLKDAFAQHWDIIAPYWTDISPNSGHVNYHLYEKCGQAAFDGKNDDATSPNKTKVFSRASEDLMKYYNFTGFDVDKVLVVTWVGVQHLYGTEKNTFQAVFISGWERASKRGEEILAGEETSYVIFMYQQGQMNWPYIAGRLIDVGYTGNVMSDTNTELVSTLDKKKGNTGFTGVFTYNTGRSSSSFQKCHSYTCSKIDLLSNPVFENEKRTLYGCPCTMERLGAQWRLYEYRGTQNEIECYAISHVAKTRLLASNKRNKLCCYRRDKPKNQNDWRDVEQAMRDASYVPHSGHVLINDPWSLHYFDNNEARENIEAQKTCCTKTTKNLCDRFYKIFPDMGCSNFVVFVPPSALGDPHITTLDGITYTLNVWGEYILMDIKSENFTLQARTSRMQSINGTLTNATVFTAFAAKEGDYAKFHVQLATNNKTLVIFVNERDITNEFFNYEKFYTELDKISVRRDDSANKTLVIATFPCGVTIKVYVAIKSLNIEMEVDKRLENKTLGLFGNFNWNKTDEFTLPNGTVLPSNMSEREIFYLFGKKWEVTPGNTVFMYENKENSSTYQHSDFVPIFVDEAPPYMVAKAENYCGKNNTACVFDYIVTGSEVFAQSTNETFIKMKSLVTNLENNPPTFYLKNISLNGFGQWVVNEQVQATLEVFTEDADGDVVYVETVDNPKGVIVKDKSIIYTANSSLPIKLGLRAKDSKGAYSSIVYVSIAVCTNCNGHGKCTNITRDTEYSDGYFQISACSCFPGYTGADCESELDACASKPCSVGQECTDLTVAQQGNNLTGYVCGPCPDGYTKSNSSDSCIDIDECSSNACQHNCTNTIGSYLCSCRDGFRLDLSDRNTCKDINECEEKTSRCQHGCKNIEGSYNCSCLIYYELKADGYTCELSSAGNQKCSQCQHTCIFNNITNSTKCTCNKGYLQDEKNDAECLDIDECKLDNMPCSQGCNNTDGNFHCYCYPGYKMESDRVSCKACEVPHYGDNCNKTCDCNGRGSCNTVKGCVCDVNWTGVNCDIDVDECAKPGACPQGQLCKNTNGSFTCSCSTGYIMEGGVCKDVDECFSLLTNGTCNLQTEVCINTVGSYRCECKHGYARDNKSICQDINECELHTDHCQHLCHNVNGGYNCECEDGYILADNRQNCIKVQDLCDAAKLNCTHGCSLDNNDKPYCICPRGYSRIVQNGNVTCFDINECSSPENNSCSYKPGCNNTDGGYTCSCLAGFKLDNNGRNCLACSGDTWGVGCAHNCTCGIGAERCDPVKGCVCKTGYTGEHCQNDINECTTGNLTCKERQVCVNLPGSATCICQAGYQFDSLGRCVDINECSAKNNCTQICTNSEGSYSCSCYAGYTYNSMNNTCLDIDECLLGKHQCDKICTNTDGSYRCSCTEGLFLQLDGVSCGADKPCNTSHCSEKCANINGSDTCLCGKGKALAKDNTSCDDLDLCKLSSCSEGCVETKGNKTFECLCNIGKYLASDGITCTECINGKYGINCNNSCSCQMSNTKTCDNVNGTCACVNGWKGETCTIDIDECADRSGSCQEHSHCLNTNGSYICVCDDGFIQKENFCAECDDNSYGPVCSLRCSCGANFRCDKTNGVCYCKPGFRGDNCDIDIDECSEAIHGCNSANHQACENSIGGYQCVCQTGYTKECDLCECKDLQFRHTVSAIITLDYTSGFDLTDKNSKNYQELLDATEKGLLESFKKKETSIISVTITNLRQGSLIIEVYITMATNNTTDRESELRLSKVLVEIMQDGIGITINNTDGVISHLIISGVEIHNTDTPCVIKSKIDPCSVFSVCVEEGKEAICRSKESNDDDRKLILGLSIGLSLFVLLTTIIMLIVCYCKRDKKKMERFEPHVNRAMSIPEDLYNSEKTQDPPVEK